MIRNVEEYKCDRCLGVEINPDDWMTLCRFTGNPLRIHLCPECSEVFYTEFLSPKAIAP